MIAPTIASQVVRVAISIPGSAGTAVTLMSLVQTTLGLRKHQVIGARVNPTTADYTAGDSTTSLPVLVTTPSSYTEPSANFLDATYVKASGVGAVSASVSIWLRG